jgi:hypothetical protein
LEWLKQFRYDPLKPLLESNHNAIIYFARRDLLQEDAGPVESLLRLKQPLSLLKKQLPGGFWEYPGKDHSYRLLETFRNLQILVYKYEFDRRVKEIASACEYLFSCQTDEGDIRGFIGNQYAPYYTGICTALLVKAGYEDDPRIEKALRWLLSVRQGDGGWVIGSPGFSGIPDLTWKQVNYLTSDPSADTLRVFDPSQPFSHSGTGMVIRAFAGHPKYRKSPETLKAARLLKSHFFKDDNYSSYRHADYWLRFEFPFWWNNLLAALDSLSLIGISPADADVKPALDWFVSNQEESGLWKISYSKIHKASENKKSAELRLWITLCVCRVFQRFYENLPNK